MSSTLTYRTETGFRISLRPVFFLLLAMSRSPMFSGHVVRYMAPHVTFPPVFRLCGAYTCATWLVFGSFSGYVVHYSAPHGQSNASICFNNQTVIRYTTSFLNLCPTDRRLTIVWAIYQGRRISGCPNLCISAIIAFCLIGNIVH